jgi:asparagine synthase (glutamine-hydrolysing)
VTIMVGCFCIGVNATISDDLKSSIKKNLRRKEDARGQTFCSESGSFFLTKWDSGAFNESAWIEQPDGSVSALVGDPLICDFDTRPPRIEQLQRLDLFSESGAKELIGARGSFCLASYSRKKHRLKLATDALGLRSVYYTVQDGVFVFSSTLRILEAINSIKKSVSVIGLAEQCVYGQPLGSRSPYENISILREAEILTVDDSGVEISQYYDWSTCASYPETEEEAAKSLHQIFVDSVRCRSVKGEHTFAFLSGGMDSRAIVATLIECGHQVTALNFSPDDSQDQRYAVRFSECVGSSCKLFCYPRNSDPNFSLLAYREKERLQACNELYVERPDLMWSGDGGSVGLGHVYMDEHMIEIFEKEGIENAIEYFTKFHGHYLPERVLSEKWRKKLPAMIFQDVLNEVSRYPCHDSGRQIYIFLLLNDQRRHLHKHFESIDEHGIEFLTPFFDSVFLRSVVATPVRWGVLHRLYAQWFAHLPPFAQITPWQTYPGHVECPVQDYEKLSYQWGSSSEAAEASDERFRERLNVAGLLFSSLIVPITNEFFSRACIVFVAVLHVFGLADAKYTLRTIEKIQQFDGAYQRARR